MERKSIVKKEDRAGAYFLKDPEVEFFSSGCSLLDCVLGGGYALGRMVNIVGDKSTGKTLLAIEACRNFLDTFDGEVDYIEAEAAFDRSYAEMLGMPKEVNLIEDIDTVEGMFKHINSRVKSKEKMPRLIVVDSLDALSDLAEKEQDIEKVMAVQRKPKVMSQMFRVLNADVEKTKICLMIISQIRDKIGVTFGARYSIAGGKAMDFYASQRLILSELEKIYQTIRKIKKPTGIWIKAKCIKNKIGLPYRECDLPIKFAYGIDDIEAAFDWVKTVSGGAEAILKKTGKEDKIENLMALCYDNKEVKNLVMSEIIALWRDIETSFLPTKKKYN